MNERDAKFFRPLWIRIAITAVCAVWFALESVFTHDSMWMTITGAAVAYCVWNFFLRFPRAAPTTTVPAAGAAPSDRPPDHSPPAP